MVESSVWAHADGVITLQWTVYIGNYYERTALVTYDDQTWDLLSLLYTTRIYYYAGSTRIAMREVVGQNSTLYWLLTDHLGSQSITANADGSFHSEIRYTAFGETRYTSANDTPTDYLYTGQRLEEELGLYYYNARFYDAALAHFIQADTVVPHPGFSLSYIRYAYVLFNPVRYTDPTGNMDYAGDGGYNIYAGSTYTNGSTVKSKKDSYSTQPKPTRVDRSKLTPGGNRTYDSYLQLFNTAGWWWTINEEGFTIQDAVVVMVFQAEGGEFLSNYGNDEQNGYTLINAWAEGAARKDYGCSCELGICDFDNYGATYGSDEWLINWMYGHNASTASRVDSINNGNDGSDIHSLFDSTYSSTNAQITANKFLNPDPSWLTSPYLASNYPNVPYSWGNSSEFIATYPDMIIWTMGNFYIPKFDGNR